MSTRTCHILKLSNKMGRVEVRHEAAPNLKVGLPDLCRISRIRLLV